jgi:hypothetical protein
MKRTVVFILGASRSGSSLLDFILGSNKNCSSLCEFFRVHTRKTVKKHDDQIKELGICGLCGKTCESWAQFEKILVPPHYHRAAFEVFKTPVLIDSSKKPYWMEYVEPSLDAEIKIIRLLRDARDRFSSCRDRFGKVRKKDVVGWMKAENNITRFLKGKEYHTMKAEDICSPPAIKECCDYVGIGFSLEMMDYWKVRHHGTITNIKAWTLVKKWHNVPVEGAWEPGNVFFEKHGYSIKIPQGRTKMTDGDMRIIEKNGALKLNKELGYA